MSSTVPSVRSRVEPPAPKVTEKNFGLSCASCWGVARSFSCPSGVLGGKNSKLKLRGNFFCDCMRLPPHSIPVILRFIRPVDRHAQVLALGLGQGREFDAELL